MTQEEYNKRVYESTQRFAELFFTKELEKGNTWIFNPGGEYNEKRMSIIKVANKCATILVNTCNNK